MTNEQDPALSGKISNQNASSASSGSEESEMRFVCRKCQKHFQLKSSWRRHRRQCGIRFPCSCTHAPFKSFEALRLHASRADHTIPEASTKLLHACGEVTEKPLIVVVPGAKTIKRRPPKTKKPKPARKAQPAKAKKSKKPKKQGKQQAPKQKQNNRRRKQPRADNAPIAPLLHLNQLDTGLDFAVDKNTEKNASSAHGMLPETVQSLFACEDDLHRLASCPIPFAPFDAPPLHLQDTVQRANPSAIATDAMPTVSDSIDLMPIAPQHRNRSHVQANSTQTLFRQQSTSAQTMGNPRYALKTTTRAPTNPLPTMPVADQGCQASLRIPGMDVPKADATTQYAPRVTDASVSAALPPHLSAQLAMHLANYGLPGQQHVRNAPAPAPREAMMEAYSMVEGLVRQTSSTMTTAATNTSRPQVATIATSTRLSLIHTADGHGVDCFSSLQRLNSMESVVGSPGYYYDGNQSLLETDTERVDYSLNDDMAGPHHAMQHHGEFAANVQRPSSSSSSSTNFSAATTATATTMAPLAQLDQTPSIKPSMSFLRAEQYCEESTTPMSSGSFGEGLETLSVGVQSDDTYSPHFCHTVGTDADDLFQFNDAGTDCPAWG